MKREFGLEGVNFKIASLRIEVMTSKQGLEDSIDLRRGKLEELSAIKSCQTRRSRYFGQIL